MTKVCRGNNAGDLLFHAARISGNVVNLEPKICMRVAALLQESSIVGADLPRIHSSPFPSTG